MLSPFVLVRAQAMRRDERLPLPCLHCRQPQPCTLRLHITPASNGRDRGRTESFVASLLRELVQRLAVQCIERKELQAGDALSFGAVELELLCSSCSVRLARGKPTREPLHAPA